MRRILTTATIIALLNATYSFGQTTYTAAGTGNWSNAGTWDAFGVPPDPLPSTDDIIIDCSCVVTNNTGGPITINGSLTIGSGSELVMSSKDLLIGVGNSFDATLTVNGTLSNVNNLKAEGDDQTEGLGSGPFIVNSGTITAAALKIGKNSGNGLLTNNSGGTITISGNIHIDGSVDNEGTMTVMGRSDFHGAILTGGGDFFCDELRFDAGKGVPCVFPTLCGGATGGGDSEGVTDIQSQNFYNAAGDCSSASDNPPNFIIGGVTIGSYQDLLDTYGLTDGTEFQVHDTYVSTCGEAPLSGIIPTGPGGIGTTDGLSNLELWLDANTIPGLSDGANVTSWDDLSGNGLSAITSGTPAEEPTYNTNTVNTVFPSISFDPTITDQYLNLGNPASLDFIPGTDSWTFYIVYNTPGTTPQGTFFAKAAQPASSRQYQYTIDDQSSTSRFTSYIGGNGIIGDITSTGAWYVSSHTVNTTNRDSWTNEGDNFASPSIGSGTGAGLDVLIGARRNATDNTGTGFPLTGSIAEIVMYNGEANTAERIIITNYLAAKYDITLTANDVYTMDDNGNGDYDFEVAGIGQASDGSNHTDAQGNGIVRILLPSDLNNDEFLMWGHDNGEEFATETSDVPGGGDPVDARFARVWRVSELNSSGSAVDIGNIDIRWDLTGKGTITASDLRLLVDTDNDGTFADETPISGATLVSGNIYEFGDVSAISNNLRFTIATANASQTPLDQLGPGNITANLSLWLSAAKGTKNSGAPVSSGTMDEWQALGGNGNISNLTVGTDAPTLLAAGMNYNPTVHFDGVDDELEKASFSADLLFSDQDNTFFYVMRRLVDSDGATYNVFGGWEVDASPGDRAAYFESRSAGGIRTDLFTENMSTATDFTDKDVVVTVTSDATGRKLFINGFEWSSLGANSMTAAGNIGTLTLGNRPNSTTSHCQESYTSEFITYNAALSASDINKVESYLALKYAITLDNSGGGTDGDYVASNGTTIWDASVNPTYQNEIIAIGRDDNADLYQKQAHHQDDSLRIFIDNLAADNASNVGTITNDVSFIVIGHNGERLMAYSPNEVPAGIFSRFDREWKITNTNFTDTYSLEFEWEEVGGFDINHIRLLVDDDGDFSNAMILDTSDGLTFTVGSIIIGGIGTSHIPAGATRYITIGSAAPATPLPIELIDFTASATDNFTVKLDWQTASENNNDFFTIERSKDAEDWKEVLMVNGAGNSSQKITYAATDKNPYSGISYYRLKQTDFDGQFTYSEIRVVNLNNLGSTELKIYPNPAKTQLTIEGDLLEIDEFKLYTVFGQDVSGLVSALDRNNSGIVVDISRLQNGIYSLQTRHATFKLVKQ